jgi:hypothetical protein
MRICNLNSRQITFLKQTVWAEFVAVLHFVFKKTGIPDFHKDEIVISICEYYGHVSGRMFMQPNVNTISVRF